MCKQQRQQLIRARTKTLMYSYVGLGAAEGIGGVTGGKMSYNGIVHNDGFVSTVTKHR